MPEPSASDAVLDRLELRPITSEDAEGLSALIARCYGESYPKRLMYRSGELADLIAKGDYGGVVAVDGAVVAGHIGFSRPSHDASVAEAGTTVIDPDWRGRGLMKELATVLAETLVAAGASGFVHFPTTAHPVMQRASLGTGGRETGIMLAYLPSELRESAAGESVEGRLAVTVVYQPILEAPSQTIHLPRRYESMILGFARSLGLEREVDQERIAPNAATGLSRQVDEPRGLERISIDSIGGDVETRVEEAIDGTAADLLQVDLPMSDPGIDHAVEALRSLGFAFCAWLPAWAGHDVLRLQGLRAPAESELEPSLFSPEAEAIMGLIRSELNRT